MNGAGDRLDRDVLAGLGAAQLLHRRGDLTVTLDRGGELPLGLGLGTVRRGCGRHGQRSSTSQFQQCTAHGQLRGLATIGQPGALQAGLGHGEASLAAASAALGSAIGWLG